MSPLNTSFWITFSITAMMSASRVFKAAKFKCTCTLYGDDQLRDHWQNLASALVQQIVGAHDCK